MQKTKQRIWNKRQRHSIIVDKWTSYECQTDTDTKDQYAQIYNGCSNHKIIPDVDKEESYAPYKDVHPTTSIYVRTIFFSSFQIHFTPEMAKEKNKKHHRKKKEAITNPSIKPITSLDLLTVSPNMVIGFPKGLKRDPKIKMWNTP